MNNTPTGDELLPDTVKADLVAFAGLDMHEVNRFLGAAEMCGYRLTRTPAPSATVGLKPMNGEPVTQDMLETLWRVVVEQDTPELQAAFTVNCLRGTIKISPEMKMRLAAPAVSLPEEPTTPQADDGRGE